MSLPEIEIIYGNGGLGTVATSEDSVAGIVASGVAVSGQFALNEVLGPFFSISEVEAKGINAAYDAINTALAYKHCKDFYELAGEGAELWLLVVAKTLTLTEILDPTLDYAKKLLMSQQGRIKLLGVTRVPDNAYNPTITQGIDPDVITAVTKAQQLVIQEQSSYRPVQILVEGRAFQGNVGTAYNFSAGTQNRISVVLGYDAPGIQATMLGRALGKLASLSVQQNIGQVDTGDIGITNVFLSSTQNISTFTRSALNILTSKGYIFPIKHPNINGFFFSNDPTCTGTNDDYNRITRGRVMDKVFRIVSAVYVRDLLKFIQVNVNTGKIPAANLKALQAKMERAINQKMTNEQEISGVICIIDPLQDVIATNTLKVKLDIIPVGYFETISVTIGFSNPNITP